MSGHPERATAPIVRCTGCTTFLEVLPPDDEEGVIVLGSYAICPHCGTIIEIGVDVMARRAQA